MDTALSLDLSVLEDLEFPTPCGHSRHSEGGPFHHGDAKYVAVSFHNCQAQPGKPPPYFYPACATWANYVTLCTETSQMIQCSRCLDIGYWEDMVKIISTL